VTSSWYFILQLLQLRTSIQQHCYLCGSYGFPFGDYEE